MFHPNNLCRPYRAFLLFVRFTQAGGLGWDSFTYVPKVFKVGALWQKHTVT